MQKKKTNKGQKKRQIPPIDNSYPHVHVRSGSRRRKTRRDLIEFLAIQQHLSAPPHLDSAAFNQPHIRAGKHTHTHTTITEGLLVMLSLPSRDGRMRRLMAAVD